MEIDGTFMAMTRGDSESITVQIKDRPLATGDKIEFTVRKSFDTDILIHKEVTEFDNGIASIVIEPADTHDLDFGKYVYDIQWTNNDGTVKTIIKPDKNNFELTKEVTY